MAIKCAQATKLCNINPFSWMLLEYYAMTQESKETDSSVSDWEFISGAVKAIFCELLLLQTGGQLNLTPGHKVGACMCTMELHQALQEDFNTHAISVSHPKKQGIEDRL